MLTGVIISDLSYYPRFARNIY